MGQHPVNSVWGLGDLLEEQDSTAQIRQERSSTEMAEEAQVAAEQGSGGTAGSDHLQVLHPWRCLLLEQREQVYQV
jgi:hypothetical protein